MWFSPQAYFKEKRPIHLSPYFGLLRLAFHISSMISISFSIDSCASLLLGVLHAQATSRPPLVTIIRVRGVAYLTPQRRELVEESIHTAQFPARHCAEFNG